MNIPIITPIVNTIKALGGQYLELQTVTAKGKVHVAAAKAQAEATALTTHATNIGDWERIQAANANLSWKDEFWTLLIAIPLFLAFIPGMVPVVQEGFAVLQEVPEWYLWAVGASLSASFGIRIGIPAKAGALAGASATKLTGVLKKS